MRLLFLLVFISLNAFSQKIELGDMTHYQNSSLDLLRQEFNVYLDNKILTIDLYNFEKRIKPVILDKSLPAGPKYLSLQLLQVQNSIYFIHGSGGLVYTLANDTLIRIDNSFDHGMQYGSPVFEHEGTIFKYGGYGFWSMRDFFTYYDKKQHEWEVFHPIASNIIPQGIGFPYFIKNQEHFHVFGGTVVNPDNRREQFNNNEVWTFDFNKTTWRFLGKHKEIKESSKMIPYRNKLLLIQKNQMAVIDIEENTKTIYRHSPITSQTNGIRHVTYANGKFYVVLFNTTGAYLLILEETDFFGEIVEQAPFYKNQAYWLKQGSLYLLVMALIIFTFWLIKKNFISRNKIKLLDNGLRYHLKFTEFDPESMAIIRLLLSEKEVSSSQILRIVEKEQYSPAHNERIKVQKINDINIKIATLLGIKDDLITNFKSSQDRRIRLYKISKINFDVKGMGKQKKS